MIERAHGLVLRTRSFTETSLIVDWLTPEFGRVSTVARGARRPKSPFGGKLDLFYEAEFTFVRSRRSQLHTLREVGLLDIHPALRRDLGYLRQASYCAALIEQTTEKDTPLPAIFGLMRSFLEALPQAPPQAHRLPAFELKLLVELGLGPAPDNSRLTPGTKQIVKALAEKEWPAIARLRLSETQIAELRQFLHGFLTFHLGKVPKSRISAMNPAS